MRKLYTQYSDLCIDNFIYLLYLFIWKIIQSLIHSLDIRLVAKLKS